MFIHSLCSVAGFVVLSTRKYHVTLATTTEAWVRSTAVYTGHVADKRHCDVFCPCAAVFPSEPFHLRSILIFHSSATDAI